MLGLHLLDRPADRRDAVEGRFSEQITLEVLDAGSLQPAPLLYLLHPFRHDADLQLGAAFDDGVNDRLLRAVQVNIGHDAAVDL